MTEQEKRIDRARRDYAFFVETYFPHHQHKCADYQIEWSRLALIPNQRATAKVYRGGGTSTHFNVLIPLWLMIQDKLGFCLLIGQTKDLAKRRLVEIDDELNFNYRFMDDFGKFGVNISEKKDMFTTNKGVVFAAADFWQTFTGRVWEGVEIRPDFVVCDGVESQTGLGKRYGFTAAEQVLGPIRNCMKGEMNGLFVVNSHTPEYGLIDALEYMCPEPDANWTHIKVPALDGQGKPTWNKFSLEWLDQRKEACGKEHFKVEFMLGKDDPRDKPQKVTKDHS